jgi:hypothetical protein
MPTTASMFYNCVLRPYRVTMDLFDNSTEGGAGLIYELDGDLIIGRIVDGHRSTVGCRRHSIVVTNVSWRERNAE